MSLFNLKQFVSKEDFADAHEPVNDGVKEVPNAQTIAASVKSGDVGADTNSPGPAKVIPEKEDTDDTTEKQFDTVSEGAEKGGSEKPAAPASTSEAKPNEDSNADSGNGATKAPPFVKKDDAEESESSTDVPPQLEHDTAEATEDEKKKTDKVTESLEKYLDHAKRFDIIGYPRRDRDELVKKVGWLTRRAGEAAPTTISFESIDAVVKLGKARSAKLEAQVVAHRTKVSTENFDEVPEVVVVEEPTESGSEPMTPAAAAELTALEIDALDVDVTGINAVHAAIGTLQEGQVALERHLEILRGNKRISKQAAAVLQAGLEHIDAVCGLKVRATGLEGYVTTPRAALEDADIDEKSLLDRAGEIGAKIIQFLRELIARGKVMWQKYQSGIAGVQTKMVQIKKEVAALKGSPTSQSLDVSEVITDYMYTGKRFVGAAITDEEMTVMKELDRIINVVHKEIAMPVIAVLKNGNVDEETLDRINEILDRQEMDRNTGKETILPGNFVFKTVGPSFTCEPGRPTQSREVARIDLQDTGILRRNFDEIYKFTGKLADAKQIDTFIMLNEKLTQALISLRSRAKQGMFDEELFQRIQSTAAHITDRYFSLAKYFDVMGALAKAQGERAKVYHWIATVWSRSYTED